MRRLLLDTHIWLWYVTGSQNLVPALRDHIDRSLGACWLSAISMWEACLLAERGRIELRGDVNASLREILLQFPVHEAPINFEIARRSRSIELEHPDPADRFIVATALVHELTLVTVDRRLSSLKEIEVLTA